MPPEQAFRVPGSLRSRGFHSKVSQLETAPIKRVLKNKVAGGGGESEEQVLSAIEDSEK